MEQVIGYESAYFCFYNNFKWWFLDFTINSLRHPNSHTLTTEYILNRPTCLFGLKLCIFVFISI